MEAYPYVDYQTLFINMAVEHVEECEEEQQQNLVNHLISVPDFDTAINTVKDHLSQRKNLILGYTVDQRKQIIQEFLDHKDFPYLDLPVNLNGLNVVNVQRNHGRQIIQLRDNLMFEQPKWYLHIVEMKKKMKSRRDEILGKVHRLYLNASSQEVTKFLNQFKNKLNLPVMSGSQRDQLKTIITNHCDNAQAAMILNRLKYPFSDIDGGFTTVHNQAEVDRNCARMKEIHTERWLSESFTVDDNPFLNAAQSWEEDLSNFKFPATACSNCHEQDLGMEIKPDGKCVECQKKSRAHKFSALNSMDPGEVPACLQDLFPIEKSAISMILPVQSIHRVNQVPHMKGHIMCLPNNVSEIVTELPRAPEHLDVVVITAPGQQHRVVNIRRNKVLEALLWLKEYNPSYKDVNINANNLNRYTDAGPVPDIPTIELGPDPVVQPDPGPELVIISLIVIISYFVIISYIVIN